MAPTGKKPPPKCKAIVLCDQVILDALTQRYTLVGLFDECPSSAYPFQMGPFRLFLQVVDGIGRYNLTVELHDLRDATVLARLEDVPFEFPERTNYSTVMLSFAGLL